MYFKNYPEKVWGIDVNKMTADWAPKRIKLTEKTSPFFTNEYTAVGKYGTGKIYEFLKKEILKNSGKINLKHEIEGIDKNENELIKIKFKNKKNYILDKNSLIISTLPITLTARFLGYTSKLKFRGIRSVYLAYKKESILLSDVTVQGDLVEKGKITVDSKITGDITAEEIEVHENSNINGNINSKPNKRTIPNNKNIVVLLGTTIFLKE